MRLSNRQQIANAACTGGLHERSPTNIARSDCWGVGGGARCRAEGQLRIIGDADFTGIKTFAFKDSPVDETKADQTAYDSPLVTERTRMAIAPVEARGRDKTTHIRTSM